MAIGKALRDLLDALQHIRVYDERLARMARDLTEVVREVRDIDRRVIRLETAIEMQKLLPPTTSDPE